MASAMRSQLAGPGSLGTIVTGAGPIPMSPRTSPPAWNLGVPGALLRRSSVGRPIACNAVRWMTNSPVWSTAPTSSPTPTTGAGMVADTYDCHTPRS